MPIFSQSRDFVTKNGIVTEGTGVATSSTGGSNIIQSGGGLAAAGNLVVGTSATIYSELVVYGTTTTVQTLKATIVTATQTSTFVDLFVRDITASGTISGTVTGNINSATNLANGTAGQVPYQSAVGVTAFVGGAASAGNVFVSNGTAAPAFKNTLTLTGSTVASNTNSGALVVQGGVGIWGALYVGGSLTAASVVGTSTNAITATNIALGTAGQLPYQSAIGVTAFTGPGTTGEILVSRNNSGPVFQNTLTLAGTTSATSTNSGALQVVGGVGIGGALYVGGSITGSLTGTATSANNLTGGAAGSIPIQSASGTTAYIPLGLNGYILSVTAGNTATWVSTAGLSAGNATTSSNLLGGTAGQVPYQSSPGITTFTGPGSEGEVLVSRGTTGPIYSNTLTIGGTTNATNSYTGALQVRGGIGIVKDLYVGGLAGIVGNVTLESSGASTATGATNALFVKGGVYINRTLVVKDQATFEGAVVFAGTATYAYSTNTVFSDNLINIHVPPGSTGSNHTWTVDDGKDIGHIFHYYKSGQDKDAFLGLANDTSYLEWYDNGTESGGVFTGTSYGIFKTGGIRLVGGVANNGDASSGDLQITGGVGIGGRIYVGSTATYNASILPTSSNVNLGSASQRFGTLFVTSSTIDIGGVPLGSDGSSLLLAPGARFTATTVASATNTGALQVVGGLGVGGSAYFGGSGSFASTSASTSPSTGALVVSGGAGIGGNLNITGTAAFGTTSSSAVVMGYVTNNSAYATYTSPAIINTVQQVLDTFSTSTYRTAKYTIQIVDGAKFHAQELLLFHDNTQIYKTEYSIIFNNAELGTFDADISSGNARLLFTAAAGVSSLVVKLNRTTITS